MARERKGRELLAGILTVPLSGSTQVLDPAVLFARSQPLEVDLGCGRGRFLLAHAAHSPCTNILGVDLITRRLAKLNSRAADQQLSNLRLLRANGLQVLGSLLPPRSVTTCYIFFPDPWPKRKHHSRRLVSAAFLDALARTLCPGGLVHIATDYREYFERISGLFARDRRFESTPPWEPPADEQTDFELLHREAGATIYRCAYRR